MAEDLRARCIAEGADRLVRLRTATPGICELDDEEASLWRQDAQVVVDAVLAEVRAKLLTAAETFLIEHNDLAHLTPSETLAWAADRIAPEGGQR